MPSRARTTVYLSKLVVRKRLVVLPGEERDVFLVAIGDVARGSDRELALGDGQAALEGHRRPGHWL